MQTISPYLVATHQQMVTHGHFIRELINLLLHTRNIVRFPHGNCAITLLSFDGAWMMDFCNRLTGIRKQA
jgi:broad specificity phosphatase PhoE